MRIVNYILLLFILIGVAQVGLTQQHYIAQTHRLGVEDGLSGVVGLIIEDSRGIVWLGGDNGLISYDGLSLNYYTKQTDGLVGNHVRKIAEDQNGHIWVLGGTEIGEAAKGISIINPQTRKVETLSSYVKDLGGLDVFDVFEIKSNVDKTIWLGTNDNRIYEYDGTSIHLLTQIENKEFFYIKEFFKIGKGIIAFFETEKKTSAEVIIFNYQKKEIVKKENFRSYRPVMIPLGYASVDSTYWAVKHRISQSELKVHFYKKIRGDSIQKIKQLIVSVEQNPTIYASQSMYVFLSEEEILYYNKEGDFLKKIPNTSIQTGTCKLVDSRGGFWSQSLIGQNELNYVRYNASLFNAYPIFRANGDSYKGGRGMTLVQDSLLYLASVLDFASKRLDTGLRVHSLFFATMGVFDDHKGRIYGGTSNGELMMYNYNQKIEKRYSFEGEETSSALNWAIHKDQAGKIWLGYNKGLYYLDETRAQIVPCVAYNGFDVLRKSTIYYIHEQGQVLWLATSSGLYQWDKKQGAQKRFHIEGEATNYLPHNIIAHIHEDKAGTFWLASKGGGLIRFNPQSEQSESFKIQEGLVNNVLYGIYEDDYDNLWMSSNWGIMRFNKKSHLIDSYTSDHGLLDNEFNTTSHYQDKVGKIYFGSQDALIIFNPKDFQDKKENFPMLLTKLNKLNRSSNEYYNAFISESKKPQIELSPQDKGFELQIALLDYRNPETHRYAYKIEGLENNWHYQKNPTIKENNLPYGHFKLQVRVKGFAGDWVDFKEPIDLIVLRPFYLQGWFLILAICSLSFMIVLIIRWRTEQLRKRQKELEKIVSIRTAKIAQQAEDLKALDKVKSRFFANISHELRTPLTLILGPVSELLSKPRGLFDELKTRKALGLVQNNGENLLKLIGEILDLSKLEAKELKLEEVSIHLESFCQKIYTTFESQANYLGINYQIRFKAKSDLYVLLDGNKVEKIVTNLLSNALKFTSRNGQIIFVIDNVEDKLVFIIKDTGKGIHPLDLPHVFERFYQARQGTISAQGGTGIGLSLVQEFTKLMEGTVHVNSILGEGTTFEVKLPKQAVYVEEEEHKLMLHRVQENQRVEPNYDTWQPIHKDKTILVVEDHVDMRNFITGLLDMDYRILTAANGLEAIAILEEKSIDIDLIISDVMMPEMDGFELLERVKQNSAWAIISIIMLTARAAEQDKLQALRIGVDDYLTKPFSIEELKVRIANLLQNSKNKKEWLLAQGSSDLETSSPLDKTIQDEIAVKSASKDLDWMKAVESLIQTELNNANLTIEYIAKKMNLSKRHFERQVKKMTGLGPAKLIKEIRLKKALTLLENRSCNLVSDVAFAVGYQRVETFSRNFKERFGKSPKDYLS